MITIKPNTLIPELIKWLTIIPVLIIITNLNINCNIESLPNILHWLNLIPVLIPAPIILLPIILPALTINYYCTTN